MSLPHRDDMLELFPDPESQLRQRWDDLQLDILLLLLRLPRTATTAADLALARSATRTAAGILSAATPGSPGMAAFEGYFHTTEGSARETVLARLAEIDRELGTVIDTGDWAINENAEPLPDGRLKVGYVRPPSRSWRRGNWGPITCTQHYYPSDESRRATVMVHEAAHKIGIMGDTYVYEAGFPKLDTAGALVNADSYAYLVATVALGHDSTVLPAAGPPDRRMHTELGGGFTFSGSPAAFDYLLSLRMGGDLTRPVVGILVPTLGLRFHLMGHTEHAIGQDGASLLATVAGGLRLDIRSGEDQCVHIGVFGGPAFAIDVAGSGASKAVGIGYEVGAGLGYRWKMLDFSADMSYFRNPTRPARAAEGLAVTGQVGVVLPFQ